MHAEAHFARRSLFAGLVANCGALALFSAIGALRLWPRISGQQLPWSLLWPFARPLLAVGLELAFLISVPIALAVAPGGTLKRPPGDKRWRATLFAVCALLMTLGGPAFGLSCWLDSRGSSPGELASELVASARQSCTEQGPRAEVTVPLLGFAWECKAGRAPRLHGRAPLGKQATFEASAIELSDDLKRIALNGFTLALPLSTLQVKVQVHARQATLRGLPPWGRSRKIPIALRAFLFAVSAGLSALAVGRLAISSSWLPGWAATLLGVCVSGCLYLAAAWLERREPHGATYLILPAAGLLSAGVLGVLLWVAGRVGLANRAAPASGSDE